MACKRYCYDGVVYVSVFDLNSKQPLLPRFWLPLNINHYYYQCYFSL